MPDTVANLTPENNLRMSNFVICSGHIVARPYISHLPFTSLYPHPPPPRRSVTLYTVTHVAFGGSSASRVSLLPGATASGVKNYKTNRL